MDRVADYSLCDRIGRAVYRGQDNSGQSVILKHNNPSVFVKDGTPYKEAYPISLRVLDYEYRMLQLAKHDGVCAVFSHIEDGEDHWIVMQDLGQSLIDISDFVKAGCSLGKVAKTLCDLHGRGIVHRDIKPKNIAHEGMLIDFDSAYEPGLFRSYGSIRRKSGTPGYMAPEAIENPHSKSLDVFSLCVTAEKVLDEKRNDFGEIARVLKEGKSDDPSHRPSMEDIARAFRLTFN